MPIETNVVGAYRTDAALAAMFTLDPGETAAIHLTYYCRYWELVNNSTLSGVVYIGFSRKGVESNIATAARNQQFPGSPPRKREFIRDDEGPPIIWVHSPATNTNPQLIEFEYGPSAKRDGIQPSPSRGRDGRVGDYPTAQTRGLLIIPGI
jgi:hypothetical protein